MLPKPDKRLHLWVALAVPMLLLVTGLAVASDATAHPTTLDKALASLHPSGGSQMLIGHVTWQGAPPPPNARQQQPITLTLSMDPVETDYLSQTTDVSGFFTVPVGGLPNGVYNWRVKGPSGGPGGNASPGYLANVGTLTL